MLRKVKLYGELAAVFDLAGIRAPKRQCTRTEFPSIGTFIA